MKDVKNYISVILFYIALIIFIFGIVIEKRLEYTGFVFLMILLIYEIRRGICRHEGKVIIDTPDGSDQPYHPSVVYLKGKWNGYSYWMAYTPFPIGAKPYQDRWEYPCIMASHDGIHWEYPGDKCPIDDLTQEQIFARDYFSDTHLVYNEVLRRLECYYRLSETRENECNKAVTIFRRFSLDGIHWSEREIIINEKTEKLNALESPVISPAIERIGGRYCLWYVMKPSKEMTGMEVFYSSSEDCKCWEERKKCNLSGMNVVPWHIDCKYYDGIFWLITYDFSQKIILWESKNGIDFSFIKTLITPSGLPGSFYRVSLYRACMVKTDECFKAYFSAGNGRKVGIGLMEGDMPERLDVISVSAKREIDQWIYDVLEVYSLPVRWIIYKIAGFWGIDATSIL